MATPYSATHCEYHSLTSLHVYPETQSAAATLPPPHWPYAATVPLLEEDAEPEALALDELELLEPPDAEADEDDEVEVASSEESSLELSSLELSSLLESSSELEEDELEEEEEPEPVEVAFEADPVVVAAEDDPVA